MTKSSTRRGFPERFSVALYAMESEILSRRQAA